MIGLGVGAYRLIGLDPDQLSLQAPFPEGLAAQMAVQATKRDHRCGVSRPGRAACPGLHQNCVRAELNEKSTI
jgi:hypothetical protein